MVMEPARDGSRRAALIGGSLCFAAVLAILVGGISRGDLSGHHRSPAATMSWTSADSHGGALRLDQPGVVAGAALLLLGALVLLLPRTFAPTPTRFTAHSPSPRGPPVQAH